MQTKLAQRVLAALTLVRYACFSAGSLKTKTLTTRPPSLFASNLAEQPGYLHCLDHLHRWPVRYHPGQCYYQ